MTLALLSKILLKLNELPIVNARVARHLTCVDLVTLCPCTYSFSYCANAKTSLDCMQ